MEDTPTNYMQTRGFWCVLNIRSMPKLLSCIHCNQIKRYITSAKSKRFLPRKTLLLFHLIINNNNQILTNGQTLCFNYEAEAMRFQKKKKKKSHK